MLCGEPHLTGSLVGSSPGPRLLAAAFRFLVQYLEPSRTTRVERGHYPLLLRLLGSEKQLELLEVSSSCRPHEWSPDGMPPSLRADLLAQQSFYAAGPRDS